MQKAEGIIEKAGIENIQKIKIAAAQACKVITLV
jgi:hypothetical protein